MMKKSNVNQLVVASSSGDAGREAPAFDVDVLRSVRMHQTLAAAVTAVVFCLMLAYALTRKPMYEAESLIYVDPLPTKVLSDGSPSAYDPSRYSSYLEQQTQTVQRPDILESAIATLPEGTWAAAGESKESAAGRLANSLKVQRVGESYQLSISLQGPNAATTAAIVNAVTTAYLEQGRKDERAQSDGKLQLLMEERQRIETQMNADRAEQTELSTRLGVANPVGPTGNPYDLQLEGMRSQLAAARAAHDVSAAQLASISGTSEVRKQGLAAAADEVIAGDAGLSSLRATISQRRAVISSQMAGMTQANPQYKQDQEELAGLDRDQNAMAKQLREKAERRLEDKLRLDLSRTGDVEARLNAQLARQTAQATSAAPRLQRASEVQLDLQRLGARFGTVDDAIRSLQMQTSGPGPAHLAVAAAVPESPVASRTKLMLIAALPLALLCGIGAAVVARKRDQHVYIAADVEREVGFAPIALMPASHEVSDAVIDEYLLRLAAGVESAHRVNGARAFVFTGASAGATASDLVASVERKLQDLGHRVQVLSAQSMLRGRGEAGVVVLERAKLESDIVLIDAPPLLQSAEAEYAVRSTDATFLVAESGVTTCGELSRATALLERLQATGVAVVLESVRLSVADDDLRSAVRSMENRGGYAEPRQWRAERPVRTESIVPEVRGVPAVVAEAVPVVVAAAPAVVREEVVAPVEQVAAPVVRATDRRVAKDRRAAKVVARAVASAEDEQRMAARASVVERVFARFHEPVVSIMPTEDEGEVEADAMSYRAVVHAPVQEAASAVEAPVALSKTAHETPRELPPIVFSWEESDAKAKREEVARKEVEAKLRDQDAARMATTERWADVFAAEPVMPAMEFVASAARMPVAVQAVAPLKAIPVRPEPVVSERLEVPVQASVLRFEEPRAAVVAENEKHARDAAYREPAWMQDVSYKQREAVPSYGGGLRRAAERISGQRAAVVESMNDSGSVAVAAVRAARTTERGVPAAAAARRWGLLSQYDRQYKGAASTGFAEAGEPELAHAGHFGGR